VKPTEREAEPKDLSVLGMHLEREWTRIEGSQRSQPALVKGNSFQEKSPVRGFLFKESPRHGEILRLQPLPLALQWLSLRMTGYGWGYAPVQVLPQMQNPIKAEGALN